MGWIGYLHIVKCKNLYPSGRLKKKLFILEWNSLYKHAWHRKVEKDLGIDVKKRDW